jgi:phage-related protein
MAYSRKPLHFIGSSKKDLREMPDEVQDVFGSALLDAQFGDVPHGARAFGEGVPHEVMKLAEDHDGKRTVPLIPSSLRVRSMYCTCS